MNSHLQIDYRGASNLPITVIYEALISNDLLRLRCVAKDWHGQGSGGCEHDDQIWSCLSRATTLNQDEQAVANRLAEVSFAPIPRY